MTRTPSRTTAHARGFTLLELLVVCAVVGILAGIAALNLRGLSVDAYNDTARFAAYVRQVRIRAMSTTSAYRIIKRSNTQFIAEGSTTCTATTHWTPEGALTFTLADGVQINGVATNAVVVCFSSRGLADGSRTVTFRDQRNKQASAEIFMGGSVTIQ